MLELASSAAKLLGGGSDAAPIAVTGCAMASPLVMPALPAAAADSTVTCSIDTRSGALRVTTAAVTAVRQGVHMTAQLQRLAAESSEQAEDQRPSAATSASQAAPRNMLADLLSAAAAAMGAPNVPQAVIACIEARCQVSSGYDMHPAVADAAIHSGAAAREAKDVAFMVSTAVGAYSAPELTVGDTACGAVAHVAVRLSAPADGTVTSSHGLVGSMPGVVGGCAISGVQARPVAPHQTGPAAGPTPVAAPPRASAWAVLRRPDFQAGFRDSRESAAAAMAAAGVERVQLAETRPLPSEELLASFRCAPHSMADVCSNGR